MNALKSVESDFLARHIASSLLSLVFFGELEHLPSHNVQYEKDQLIYVYQQTQNKLKLNDLTELQKQVVWTIVNVDVLWVIPHNLLEYYGLPADRDEIRRLLESYHDDYS